MIGRRDFITLLVGSATWPVAARAQQSGMPVVGWLSARSPDVEGLLAAAFRKGVAETGFVEGRTVAIESHWAYGQRDRLPALAGDLLRRQPSVITVAGSGLQGVKAVRALNPTIPIVFSTAAADPVQAGFVASLTRPTGNITGVSHLGNDLGNEVSPKRLELLHELLPQASNIAYLLNPAAEVGAFPSPEVLAAAQTLGLTLHPLRADSERDIDDAFAALPTLQTHGLVIETGALFTTRVEQLAELALRHKVPAICQFREFATAGGLVSYGGNLAEAYRLAGIYVGRVLKGEKPADLPIQQVTKFELVINLKTARALGLTVPPSLLARADEVIE
jgi:putative ABC transport system substrate-binding protein